MFIWIGKSVDPNLLGALFGMPSYDRVPDGKVKIAGEKIKSPISRPPPPSLRKTTVHHSRTWKRFQCSYFTTHCKGPRIAYALCNNIPSPVYCEGGWRSEFAQMVSLLLD